MQNCSSDLVFNPTTNLCDKFENIFDAQEVETTVAPMPVVCPTINVTSPFCSCDQNADKPGTIQFTCGYLIIAQGELPPSSSVSGDSIVSQLLDSFLKTQNVSPLTHLLLELNNLTRIPHQIRKFHQLESIVLNNNEIKSIDSGAFNFTGITAKLISVEVNGLETIAPGAFQGLIYLQFCTFSDV